jgi:hypothetical protein
MMKQNIVVLFMDTKFFGGTDGGTDGKDMIGCLKIIFQIILRTGLIISDVGMYTINCTY